MHYLLTYDVVPDYAERRGEFRDEHLKLARAAARRGDLVLGGALSEHEGATKLDGTALLFRGSAKVAEDFAKADPYVTNGLVTRWRVQRFTTVVGADALTRSANHGGAPESAEAATREGLVATMAQQRLWTVSTIGKEREPHSAVVGVAVRADLALVFDTFYSTRKAADLTRDPRVALTMWAGELTVQLEGRATIAVDPLRDSVQASYLATFPDGAARANDPGLIYVIVRPTWIRISDYATTVPKVVELDADTIQRILTA